MSSGKFHEQSPSRDEAHTREFGTDLRLESLFKVNGKIVLVTGGGSGIGKMIATGFAQNGAKVYIAARKENQLKESKAGCNALIAEFRKRENKLHVLVNNSGITWGGPFLDFPEEKGWDNVFNVNVKSIFTSKATNICLSLSDLLTKDSNNRDPGRVINISSTASVEPASEGLLSSDGNGTWSYQPSKAAVNHLTSQLAYKLNSSHITVNAICPGLFPSKMTAFGLKLLAKKHSMLDNQRVASALPPISLDLLSSSPRLHQRIYRLHILLDGGSRFTRHGIAPALKL
ncbi:hypothetical protein BJ912DRAFT_1047353 [Pholiota molesta]|nr:hypothetical protein BJ912DRAFT_1047353 [Pholiota molesta]